MQGRRGVWERGWRGEEDKWTCETVEARQAPGREARKEKEAEGKGERYARTVGKRTMGNRTERPGRKSRKEGGRPWERWNGAWASWRERTWPEVRELQLAGARGRGLISISNGCEMRLGPLEAVRV